MAQLQNGPSLNCLEEAVNRLFCLLDDDAYARLKPMRQTLRISPAASGAGSHRPRPTPAT